ncbi:MAG TPA: FAD-dependent oxidoreductase, partial [Sphingomicrobium sp.]|nr:FAD-dependent oxidoreductase [Sphingomicrobium sp.]
MALTRRRLLGELGLLGGAGASVAALQMLGISSPGSAKATGFALPPGSGSGKTVVVLGAGIAGLVAAYELRKAGYAVTVLEAQNRIGGRVLTIRGSERIEQIDRPLQHANFSNGQYFNAGAARIPSSHHAILGYARQFNVPMEVFVNTNRATGWDFGGKVHRDRQMIFDLQGRIAEMLVSAMDHQGLDTVMPKADRDLFRGFLTNWAGLDAKGKLLPGPVSGFVTEPGGYDRPGVPLQRLGLKEILSGPAVGLPLVFESIIDMQATMLQPIGGMDRIAAALFEQVRPSVRLGVPVTAIRREGAGVRIEHKDGVVRADH